LIAANLLIPNLDKTTVDTQINERWATTTTKWFKDEINTFYYHYSFPLTAIFFCSLIVAFVVAGVGFRITDKMFKSFEYDDILLKFN